MQRTAQNRTLNKINDSSEEDNELGEETISGENDVEYAEFSLSLRTSPKEQLQTNANDCNSLNGIQSATNCGGVNMNEFDDFMSLPISANVSSKFEEAIDPQPNDFSLQPFLAFN